MDYLDPIKQRKHIFMLYLGYLLIAVAVVIATIVLVYQAYGFGLDKNGVVIQNGIVFISSQPSGGSIDLNNKRISAKTNTRQAIAANLYDIKISKPGYNDWIRKIAVDGGAVQHYDYPLLLPTKPKTSLLATLPSRPSLNTQSPDRRWLLLSTDTSDIFSIYDLKNPTKPATIVTLPANVSTQPTTAESWPLAEWADDNQHVLLTHISDDKTEYILLDRQNPDLSINLNVTLGTELGKLTLNNKKYDQYYNYLASTLSLQSLSQKNSTPVEVSENVLAYKTYGNDTIIVIVRDDALPGKAVAKIITGSKVDTLRTLNESSRFLVDIATYEGVPYVLVGSTSENKTYLYKDPLAQLASRGVNKALPMQVFRVAAATYEAFSSNAQFVLVEQGQQVMVYDLEMLNGYKYTLPSQLDTPQTHVTWSDAHRIVYTSSGQLNILDYDAMNRRVFTASDPNYVASFSPNYRFVITLTPAGNGVVVNSTSLISQ